MKSFFTFFILLTILFAYPNNVSAQENLQKIHGLNITNAAGKYKIWQQFNNFSLFAEKYDSCLGHA